MMYLTWLRDQNNNSKVFPKSTSLNDTKVFPRKGYKCEVQQSSLNETTPFVHEQSKFGGFCK